jgi:hypothetical protein
MRSQAQSLRQWPIIVDLAERVARIPEFDGLLLLGSFAAGVADDLSDVDFVAVVADCRFPEAWRLRSALETPGRLVAWDSVDDPNAHAGAHKWITRDIVKVECALVDPGRGEMKLADPFAVIAGDAEIADRFPRIPPIARDVLEDYAEKLRSEGRVPEVEMRYGDLKTAIRAARRDEA